MAIPNIQFDPFGDWRRWRQENPDSPLARIPVPPSPGEADPRMLPFAPSPVSVGGAVRMGMPKLNPSDVGLSMGAAPAMQEHMQQQQQQQQGPLAQDSADEAERPPMGDQFRNYRQSAMQDLHEMGESPRPGSSLYSERPPQPEGQPPMPLPYPDVGPNWEVRRQAAQSYPLTQEAHDDMFRTGMAYDPYGRGGAFYQKGMVDPRVEVRGMPHPASGTLLHEMGHKWYFEDLPPNKQAEWARDWAEYTSPEVMGHMRLIETPVHMYPIESFAYMMDMGPEHIPDRMQQQFLSDIFEEDAESSDNVPNIFVRGRQRQPWVETDTRHEVPDNDPVPVDLRIEADIERFNQLDRPLTEEQSREREELEMWRRMRERMRQRQWQGDFDHVPWFNAAG